MLHCRFKLESNLTQNVGLCTGSQDMNQSYVNEFLVYQTLKLFSSLFSHRTTGFEAVTKRIINKIYHFSMNVAGLFIGELKIHTQH